MVFLLIVYVVGIVWSLFIRQKSLHWTVVLRFICGLRRLNLCNNIFLLPYLLIRLNRMPVTESAAQISRSYGLPHLLLYFLFSTHTFVAPVVTFISFVRQLRNFDSLIWHLDSKLMKLWLRILLYEIILLHLSYILLKNSSDKK